MAQTFTLEGFPDTVRFQVSATSDLATKVSLKTGSRRVSVNFESDAGKLAFTGQDAAAISANHTAIAADSLVEIAVEAGTAAIYVATVAATATWVSVTIENR